MDVVYLINVQSAELLERERKYDGAYIVIERVCKNQNCDSNYRIREDKINSCDIEI